MPRTQLGSDSLPREFFAPGFRAPIDDLPAKVQQQFHELRTATPSLLRVIAIGGGLSWALLLTQHFALSAILEQGCVVWFHGAGKLQIT